VEPIKHLFVVNPVAKRVKGSLNAIIENIRAFFNEYPHMRYEIHVTRWERDALCVIRQHAMKADELLRVHIMGGTGTLSEAVNSAVNMPNLQLAAYPYGNENIFLQYFGADKTHMFSSIRGQVFSDTTPIDAIRAGNNYGISHGLVGLEAAVGKASLELYQRHTWLGQGFAHILAVIKTVYGQRVLGQEYKVDIDGRTLDGAYLSILVANGPCYAKHLSPAAGAHPNDGLLDIYLIKKVSRLKLFTVIRKYLSGNYAKASDVISHYRGRVLKLSAVAGEMNLILDDKAFYEKSFEYEILPYAVDFVCPGGIDVEKLPKVYGKTE
jgi:diacylglycerol kinase family enzyme